MKYGQRLLLAFFATSLLLLLSLPLAAQESVGFTKAFSPATIGPGSVSTLRFDISNSSGGPLTGLAFTDVLPAAVTIADPANASSNCGATTLSAPAGGGSIGLSDGSVGEGRSCFVLVNVTSSTTGTHTNISGDLASDTGSYGNASADLTVDDQRPVFSKGFSPDSIEAGGRSTLTFTIDNTANASSVFSLNFVDNLPAPMVVASPSNVSKTCSGGEVTANPGAISIAYSASSFLDAGATCTISVDVTANFSGVLNNVSGELTSTKFPAQSFLDSGKASASLDASIGDIHLVKTFIDDPVAPGDTVRVEFTILNRTRAESATGIAFEDDLDGSLTGLVATGLPLIDACGVGSTLTGTSNLSFSGGSLPAEGSCTFSVTLQVPPGAVSGAYYNETTAITADLAGRSFDGNIASDTLFVNVAPVLSKEFLPGTAGGGETVTMRFTVNSAEAATDIAFEDNLTAFIEGFSVADISLPANDFCGAGSTIFLTFSDFAPLLLNVQGGSVAAGGFCTFDVELTLPDSVPGGVTTNTTSEISATIAGTTRVGNPASANLTVVSTPKLSKDFIDDPIQPGDTVTLRFTITNLEATTEATLVTFSDDLESTGITGLAAVGLPQADVCGTGSSLSGTTEISLTGGTIGLDDFCTFAVTVQVPAETLPGSYTNTTGSLTATVDGVVTTGLPAEAGLHIAGLELTKSFTDDPVIPGDTVTLEFTLTNTSPTLDATDILFTDNLSSVLSGLTAISFSPAEPCGAGSAIAGTSFIVFQNGTLPAATSCTFSATLQVPAAASNGSFRNVTSRVSATMNGTPLDLDPATDNLEVSDQLLSFSKSFDKDTVAPGDDIGLTFTITNLSASDGVTGIAFTDNLDAALTGLVATGLPSSDDCGVGSTLSGTDTITLTGGELAAGDFCQFIVTLTVPGDAAYGALANNVTSEISGLLGGFAVSGEPATDTFKVHAVEFSKTFAAGDVYEGAITTLNFTITNFSDATVDRMIFSDDLEATLSGLMASGLPVTDICGEGSSITGTGVQTFSGGALAAGEFCSFDVSILVPGGATPGSYLNVTSDLTVGGNEIVSLPASDTLVIVERPPTTVTICHKPGTRAEKTKVIDVGSLEGHLNHGDYLGPCVSAKRVKSKK